MKKFIWIFLFLALFFCMHKWSYATPRVDIVPLWNSVTVNGTSTVSTDWIGVMDVHFFGIGYIGISSSGTADIKIEFNESFDNNKWE